MTATDATMTTAIPEAAKASIPIPSQAVTTAVASQDAANVPANEGTTQVAKEPAVAAKPEAKAVSKMPAKPAGKAVQAVLKPSAKPILKATPKASVKQAVSQKAEKVLKEKKSKLVRDSFTIPKAEYTVLDELKHRAGKLGSSIKKSELIRAGIKALAAMPDAIYLGALKVVPIVKTGRPSKK